MKSLNFIENKVSRNVLTEHKSVRWYKIILSNKLIPKFHRNQFCFRLNTLIRDDLFSRTFTAAAKITLLFCICEKQGFCIFISFWCCLSRFACKITAYFQ